MTVLCFLEGGVAETTAICTLTIYMLGYSEHLVFSHIYKVIAVARVTHPRATPSEVHCR
jgi:hypothetical protein